MPFRRSSKTPRNFLSSAIARLALLAFWLTPVFTYAADSLYTWKDSEGRTHYSTTPQNPEAKEANLPDIKRENLSEKIDQLRSATPNTCHQHGGVDCSQGADADGSVVCIDGTRDAITPFQASCLEVKLSYGTPTLLNDANEVLGTVDQKLSISSQQLSLTSVHITLRNRSAVQATGVNIKIVLPGSIPIDIFGPDTVEPFGVADYIFPIKLVGRLITPHELREARFKVRCENCSSVARVRN